MTGKTADSDDARRALGLVLEDGIDSVRPVPEGVNDSFVVTAGDEQLVCKFATYSRPVSFREGVAACRLLGAHTALPVPAVYALRTDPPGSPAFQLMEFLSGSPPPDPAESGETATARALGAVIAAFASVPDETVTGYGPIRDTAEGGASEGVVGGYDDCADWFVDYGSTLYDDTPDHDRLATVAAAVPHHLRANSDRFPAEPDPSVVVTDIGHSNLLTPNGRLAGNGTVGDLSGVLDLERAKLGPAAFTGVNTEYLLTRGVEDPDPLVGALYDPLPFGPDLPRRDLYRLLALGRSVHALDL
ncbi:MAG: putative aminoglycoside phosphotransferase [halophilic archaeon J07HX64]|jgi:Predicted aminoglycoside phosphotransferase|nr:MAG: putative aminoglycoside phosphotransferase [halophilic archaeon J07HX64]